MKTFQELVAARRDWIDNVLKPWCRQASRTDLRKAEAEWDDIAGRVAPEATLWTWAWSRFPALVHENMAGLNETHEVTVALKDGRTVAGYPDNRQSEQGQLVLMGRGDQGGSAAVKDSGPHSIDDVVSVTRNK